MRSMKGLVFIVLIFAVVLAGCGGVRPPMKEAAPRQRRIRIKGLHRG